jgi:diacylglycerol kinase (ATP)
MGEHVSTDSDPRQVLISVNPMAGAKTVDAEVRWLASILGDRGFGVEVLTDLGEVCHRANRLHEGGTLRALVGVGGDGTVAELVNRTLPGTPITILPSGNENLVARHLGMRFSAEALAETIAGRRLIRLDAGRAGGRLFVIMISCGFDAEVVRRFQQRRTGHISSSSYVWPILQTVAHYEYPRMVLYSGEAEAAGPRATPAPAEACWLFAFNLPLYATRLRFAPEADGTDGLLDVCTFRRGSLWRGLGYLSMLAIRQHRRLADCDYFRTDRLRIDAEGKVPYQLDGDFAGYLPVEVEMVPERVTFLVPGQG